MIASNDRTFPSARFRGMSVEQCQKIHEASLRVMERAGVRLYKQEAIGLLEKAGFHVLDGNRVYIPSGHVERAFSMVPKRLVLSNRRGSGGVD